MDISDGETNEGIVLGSGVQGSTDHWTSSQPVKFKKLIVTFTTGTGVVSIQTN